MGVWGEAFSESDSYLEEIGEYFELIEVKFLGDFEQWTGDEEDLTLILRPLLVGILKLFKAARWSTPSTDFIGAARESLGLVEKVYEEGLRELGAGDDFLRVAAEELAESRLILDWLSAETFAEPDLFPKVVAD